MREGLRSSFVHRRGSRFSKGKGWGTYFESRSKRGGYLTKKSQRRGEKGIWRENKKQREGEKREKRKRSLLPHSVLGKRRESGGIYIALQEPRKRKKCESGSNFDAAFRRK